MRERGDRLVDLGSRRDSFLPLTEARQLQYPHGSDYYDANFRGYFLISSGGLILLKLLWGGWATSELTPPRRCDASSHDGHRPAPAARAAADLFSPDGANFLFVVSLRCGRCCRDQPQPPAPPCRRRRRPRRQKDFLKSSKNVVGAKGKRRN